MKPKTMILAVVAVVCGLVASYLTNQLLAQRTQPTEQEPTVKVVVAVKRIQPYAPLKDIEKNFIVKDFPESIAPKKALHDLDKLKDQKFNKPVDADKPVTEDDLMKNDAGFLGSLKNGERAVAIRVNAETLVGGFIQPGSRVDVVCTAQVQDKVSTKIILENMLVLAIGQADARDDQRKVYIDQTVTLAAKPEEANRLALGQRVGELRLTLRSLNDNGHVGSTATIPTDLDNPSSSGSSGDDRGSADPAPARRTTAGAVPTPDLEEPTKPTPAPARVEPVKTHILTINNGQQRVRAVFTDGKDTEDEPAPMPKTGGR
jgi:pilus assembly protein CpaB